MEVGAATVRRTGEIVSVVSGREIIGIGRFDDALVPVRVLRPVDEKS